MPVLPIVPNEVRWYVANWLDGVTGGAIAIPSFNMSCACVPSHVTDNVADCVFRVRFAFFEGHFALSNILSSSTLCVVLVVLEAVSH